MRLINSANINYGKTRSLRRDSVTYIPSNLFCIFHSRHFYILNFWVCGLWYSLWKFSEAWCGPSSSQYANHEIWIKTNFTLDRSSKCETGYKGYNMIYREFMTSIFIREFCGIFHCNFIFTERLDSENHFVIWSLKLKI